MNPVITQFVLIAALLVWIMYRQTQPKAVKEERPYVLMIILAALGLVQIVQLSQKVNIPLEAYVLMVIGLVSGAAFGLLRGSLLHVWRNAEGVLMRQGNWVTVVLWIVGLGVHLGLDQLATLFAPSDAHSAAESLGGTSVTLYIGITLAAQSLMALGKARRLEHSSLPVKVNARVIR